jgi:hypothetical protein
MERQAIKLTGAQETLLVTLYGKAMDSRSPDSVLHDREADICAPARARRRCGGSPATSPVASCPWTATAA